MISTKVFTFISRSSFRKFHRSANVLASKEPLPWKLPTLDIAPDLPHTPVMPDETLFYMNLQPGQTVLDMTFGAGGHSRKMLESTKDIRVYALDRDPVAYSYAEKLAQEFPGQVVPMLGKFSDVRDLLNEKKVKEGMYLHAITFGRLLPDSVDAILFDLGCSSMQFDDPDRGFAINRDGPLDMRMDGDRNPEQPTASQILQYIEEEDLARILKVYGEEKKAKIIARAVVEARYMFHPLDRTSSFADLVAAILEKDSVQDKLDRPAHCATKTFMAIRIFVNNELNELNRGMELAHELLKVNGTMVALTFHSLEDRIVKRHMVGIDMEDPIEKSLSQKFKNAMHTPSIMEMTSAYTHKWSVVTKHVVNPTFYEVKMNPRARSAKLRCATKN